MHRAAHMHRKILIGHDDWAQTKHSDRTISGDLIYALIIDPKSIEGDMDFASRTNYATIDQLGMQEPSSSSGLSGHPSPPPQPQTPQRNTVQTSPGGNPQTGITHNYLTQLTRKTNSKSEILKEQKQSGFDQRAHSALDQENINKVDAVAASLDTNNGDNYSTEKVHQHNHAYAHLLEATRNEVPQKNTTTLEELVATQEQSRVKQTLLQILEDNEEQAKNIQQSDLALAYIEKIEEAIDTEPQLFMQHHLQLQLIDNMIDIDQSILVLYPSQDPLKPEQRLLCRYPQRTNREIQAGTNNDPMTEGINQKQRPASQDDARTYTTLELHQHINTYQPGHLETATHLDDSPGYKKDNSAQPHPNIVLPGSDNSSQTQDHNMEARPAPSQEDQAYQYPTDPESEIWTAQGARLKDGNIDIDSYMSDCLHFAKEADEPHKNFLPRPSLPGMKAHEI